MSRLKNEDFGKCKKSLENIAVMLDCAQVCLECLNYNKECLLDSEAESINNSKNRVREIVKRIDEQLCSE